MSQAGANNANGGNGTPITKIEVDTSRSPGTNPVVANSMGEITMTGGQVASGTSADVILTNSVAANTVTIQIQQSTTNSVSDSALNGVSHYNAADFSVDSNGFVSLASGMSGGFVWSNQNSNFNAVANNGYMITSSPVTATMPVFSPGSYGTSIAFAVTGTTASPISLTIYSGSSGVGFRYSTATSGGPYTHISNTQPGDTIWLIYDPVDSCWMAFTSIGNWTLSA